MLPAPPPPKNLPFHAIVHDLPSRTGTKDLSTRTRTKLGLGSAYGHYLMLVVDLSGGVSYCENWEFPLKKR